MSITEYHLNITVIIVFLLLVLLMNGAKLRGALGECGYLFIFIKPQIRHLNNGENNDWL